jgi:hypothetical protein
MRGRLDLAKLKVLRLFRGPVDEDSSVSSSSTALVVAPNEASRPFADHSFTVESKKAQTLLYYRMMLDRPR